MTRHGDDALVDERSELDDAELEALLIATPVITPPVALKARVFASIDEVSRFDALAQRLADLADLAVDKARELLRDIDDAARWMAGAADGVTVFHIEAGPKLEGAIVGFLRIEPGARFPDHTHIGEERAFVLQGAFESHDGVIRRAGELDVRAAGTAHGFRCHGDKPCIFFVSVQEGIQIDEAMLGPDDPRM